MSRLPLGGKLCAKRGDEGQLQKRIAIFKLKSNSNPPQRKQKKPPQTFRLTAVKKSQKKIIRQPAAT